MTPLQHANTIDNLTLALNPLLKFLLRTLYLTHFREGTGSCSPGPAARGDLCGLYLCRCGQRGHLLALRGLLTKGWQRCFFINSDVKPEVPCSYSPIQWFRHLVARTRFCCLPPCRCRPLLLLQSLQRDRNSLWFPFYCLTGAPVDGQVEVLLRCSLEFKKTKNMSAHQ